LHSRGDDHKVFRVLAVVTGAVPLRDDGHVDQPSPYPSGLMLAGRRVLMVGGGHVAQRRVPQLIAAGADVVLVAPHVTPSVEGLATAGEITWHQRGFEDADL
jgi:uroporphyrin-III C-methyltransferase/precorrin-2 dehydrogenase/sirohydrochlorin ferrochelatase